MDLKIEKNNYKKKKINSIVLSVGFLIFSIVLTGVLYFYNMNLIDQNNEINNNITTKQKSITELEKNPKIVASSLYNLNKNSIVKLEDYSKVSFYINHLTDLRRKYNIDFKGFKYSNGKLSTQVIASSDSYLINYKKVVRFIEKYRKNEDFSALFNLNLVKNIVSKNDGVDNVFNINLDLKNNISKILEESEEKKLELEKNKKEKIKEKQDIAKKAREKFLKEKQLKNNSGAIENSNISQ